MADAESSFAGSGDCAGPFASKLAPTGDCISNVRAKGLHRPLTIARFHGIQGYGNLAAPDEAAIDGKSLPRIVHRPRCPCVCTGRDAGAHADFDDRHRPDHHACAVERRLCAGGCGGGDVCLGHGVLRAAGIAVGGPLWAGAGAADRSADRWRRVIDVAAVHAFAGAGLDVVRVRRAGRVHAEHVGDGAGALDRDLSWPAAIADGVCAGVGARRSVFYRRAAAVGGLVGRGVSRGRAAGGVVGTGHRCDGVCRPAQHRTARARAGVAASGLDHSLDRRAMAAGVDAGDGRDRRSHRCGQRRLRSTSGPAGSGEYCFVGVRDRLMPGRHRLRCDAFETAVAAPISLRRRGDGSDHAAAAFGEQHPWLVDRGIYRRAVLFTDVDCGDGVDRTHRAAGQTD